MDDFIYTLLIFAWIAYGVYSAVKKNKAKNAPPRPTQASAPRPAENIEDVLKTFFDSNSTQEAQHPYYSNAPKEEPLEIVEDFEENSYEDIPVSELDVVPPKEATLEEIMPDLDTYSGSDNVELATVDSSEEDEDSIEKTAITDAVEESSENEKVRFDLRQAIVAQVLLERPYQ